MLTPFSQKKWIGAMDEGVCQYFRIGRGFLNVLKPVVSISAAR